MNQEDILHRIRTLLARFQEEVKIDNSNGELSINIHAENVLLKVLNVAYELNLYNVNYEEGKTFPAIDLRDEDRRTAFQISSTGTVNKIVHTLQECIKNGMDEQFDHLYFYFLKGMEKTVRTDSLRIIKEKGRFDIKNIHFLDHATFYQYLNQIDDMGKLAQIKDLLEEQFVDSAVVEERTIPTQGAFVSTHPDKFFGRKKMIEEMLGYIEKEKVILVSGEGGIGKTEFCREILARAEETGISCTAVNLIECRTFDDMIRRIAGQYGIAVHAKDRTDQIEQIVFEKIYGILYLDNFEDIISERNAEAEQQRLALSFLRKCRSKETVTVLISSRYKLEVDFAIKEKELDVLDEEAAVNLFAWLWTRDDCFLIDDEMKKFVVNDLHRYPLSIVLTAKQRRYVSSIKRLQEKWRASWSTVSVKGMENNRHRSLATALHMTYIEIKDKENARTLWELFTLYPNQIEESAAERLVDEYDDALKNLVNLGIIHMNDEYLSVQPTLRQFIKETEEYQDDIRIISEKLLDYYTDIFGKDGNRKWGSEEFVYAAEHLQDALFFLDWLIEKKQIGGIGKIHYLIQNYYQIAPYEAVIPLRKALFLSGYEDYIKANLLENCGDLEMRINKLSEAESHYKEAEILCRQISHNLGLTNVLQAMGDLEMRTNKLSEAALHYKEVEGLCRRSQYDLGLARVLKAMGDLELRIEKHSEAALHYKEAEVLCRQIPYDLGLANVLKAMGDLEMRTANLSEAEAHYKEAEVLCRQIMYDLGLANVLKAIGDLKMRTNKFTEALSNYKEAEMVYRQKNFELDLANVLRSMGDLEMRTSNLAEATSHYKEAELLCRRIHADLGLANVLQAMGDLEKHTDKISEAASHYKEVETICRRIQYNSGLARVLQAMGDLEMRTANLSEAEAHYKEAEVLCRQISYDLGLANVLKAMGDIEMRTDKLSEAESHYKEAEALCRQISYDLGLANVLRAMGDIEMRTDKLSEAESHYKEAEIIYRRTHDDLGLANVLRAMGNLLQSKEEYSIAIDFYKNALTIYKKTKVLIGFIYTASEICYCYAQTGDKGRVIKSAIMIKSLCEKLPYEDVKNYCQYKVITALMLINQR